MGRWAQRRLAGGGVGQPENFLTGADMQSTTRARLHYALPLTASSLIPSQFTTDNGRTGILAAQVTATDVDMTFDNTITLSQQVDYTGTTPYLKSPDFSLLF